MNYKFFICGVEQCLNLNQERANEEKNFMRAKSQLKVNKRYCVRRSEAQFFSRQLIIAIYDSNLVTMQNWTNTQSPFLHRNSSLKSYSRENKADNMLVVVVLLLRIGEKKVNMIPISICYEITVWTELKWARVPQCAKKEWFMAFRWHNYSLLLHMFAFVLNFVQL